MRKHHPVLQIMWGELLLKKIILSVLFLLLLVSSSSFLAKKNSYFQIHKQITEESWANGRMPIEIPIIVDSKDNGPYLSFVSTNYDSFGLPSKTMTKETAEFMDSTKELPEGKVIVSSSKNTSSDLKVLAILAIPSSKYTLDDIRSSIELTDDENRIINIKNYELSLAGLYPIFSPPEIQY